MMDFLSKTILFIFFIVSVAACEATSNQREASNNNNKMSDNSVVKSPFFNMQKKPETLDNYLGKGKWTIVEIWESNCAVCRQHMPSMVAFNKKMKNVRLLGISIDGLKKIKQAQSFIDEFNIPFPTLITNFDALNHMMMSNLGEELIGTPTFIIFDDNAKLVAAQAGVVSVESLEKYIVNKQNKQNN